MNNGVTFYADINYQGKSWTFDGDQTFVGDGNDQFSSVRVPQGVTVELYEHSDFGGAKLVLTSDSPDLRAFIKPDGSNWNDAASSVKFTGGAAAQTERLKKGDKFIECSSTGNIVLASTKTDASKVKVTPHDDKHYDATFLQSNKTLSIQPDGSLQSRPGGTYGGYEQLDAITAPDPNQVNLLYRVDAGTICGGTVLQIVKE